MENKEGFQFTYSAAQQQEIENIRKKYLPREVSKMDQLRALHQSATKKAQLRAISLGTVGALILGGGMSLAMSDLGAILGVDKTLSMLLGVIIGVVGMLLVALAYPVYNRSLEKERAKVAPAILQLSDELLK